MAAEYRAVFDAEVVLANGGGLRTEGFRLDIPGPEIDDAGLGALFVRPAPGRWTASCWPRTR